MRFHCLFQEQVNKIICSQKTIRHLPTHPSSMPKYTTTGTSPHTTSSVKAQRKRCSSPPHSQLQLLSFQHSPVSINCTVDIFCSSPFFFWTISCKTNKKTLPLLFFFCIFFLLFVDYFVLVCQNPATLLLDRFLAK
jgi:hypothetical protein